ncbi:hypothetical protein LCGC14_1388460, partial [marine sediment metagenome]
LNVKASSKEAAESYFFLASAGLDAAQSIKALPAVAEFAMAGNFDMARATDLLTDAQSALGLSSKDATENLRKMSAISDVLVKANTLANASVEQFSESLTNKAGAALRLLNKDMAEGVAVLAAFADQGVKGTEAGEKLNVVLRDLQVANIKGREQWERLGVSVFDSDGKMRNIADIVGGLTGALSGMSDEQKRTTLSQLQFQDRSISAIMTLLGLSDKIRDYEGELRKAGGTTKEVADLQRKSFAFAMSQVKERVTQAAIALGASLVPVLLDLAKALPPLIDRVTAAAKWFGSLPGPLRVGAIAVVALVAALGPLLFVLGTVASGLGPLIPLIWKFRTALMAVGSTVGAVFAVGAVAYALTTWLVENTSWGRKLVAVLANLINKLRGVDLEALERGRDITKEWTEEQRAAHAAFVESRREATELSKQANAAAAAEQKNTQDAIKLTAEQLAMLAEIERQRGEKLAQLAEQEKRRAEVAEATAKRLAEAKRSSMQTVGDAARELDQAIALIGLEAQERQMLELQQKEANELLSHQRIAGITVEQLAMLEEKTREKYAALTEAARVKEMTLVELATQAGFQTRAQLQQTANEAVSLYSRMLQAGTYTAQALKKAWADAEKAKQDLQEGTTEHAKLGFEGIASAASSVLSSMFGKSKAGAIAATVMNTAQAIIKTFAEFGFPWGLIPAAAMAAAGAKQMARIKSQSASFAKGTPGLDFASFGAASSVDLHGQEAVVPRGGGHLLAGEIASAMPGGDDQSLERLDRIAESLDELPSTMTRAWKNALASA